MRPSSFRFIGMALTGILGLIVTAGGCSQQTPVPELSSDASPPETNIASAVNQETSPDIRPTDSASTPIAFADVTPHSGINFLHVSGDSPEKPFPAANGSGLAALDFDLDGLDDLVFLNGATFPISPDNADNEDRCFRNLGSFRFVDVSEPSGIGSRGYSAGAATGDLNLDGFPDLFVNCFGEDLLYLNQGDGTFHECAGTAGVSDPMWGTSALTFDFDFDGDLDLYVCNYAEWSWETSVFCGDRQKGIRIFCSPRSVKPVPDRLFENLGDGTFQEALSQAHLDRPPARSQGAVVADINNDGLADLYVSNDLNPNSLFRAKGDGTFEDLSDVSGAAVDFAGQIQAGMGVDIADVDRDGSVEIFVTNYEGEHNTLYKNLGGTLFQDSSQSEGLAAPSMKWVGWGTRFADFDVDGWVDLVITNGHTDNNLQKLGRDSQYAQPPLLFHNQNGRLNIVNSPSGNYFSQNHPGRALCIADLDLDLRPDLVIGHKDEAPALLQNVSRGTVADSKRIFRLGFVGIHSNRDAVGLQIEIEDQKPLVRCQVTSGGSYLSSHTRFLTLVTSSGTHRSTARIRWPDGQEFTGVPLPERSGTYFIAEGHEAFFSLPSPRTSHVQPE